MIETITNNKISANKKNIYIFFVLILFRLVLDYSYINYVSVVYSYDNFVVEFDLFKYLISYILFFILFYTMPKNTYKISTVILYIHFIIMYIPLLSFYALTNQPTSYIVMCCFCFFIECLLVQEIKSIKVYKLKYAKYFFYIIICSVTTFVYASMILANGVPTLKALNFMNVYDIRDTVKYPFLMSYLVGWQAKVINPFMIASAYKNKNKFILVCFIFLQLIIYLITAHKAFILIPIAIIGCMRIFKSNKNIFLVISCLALCGIIGGFLLYKLDFMEIVPSLFIRRFLYVPAQLKFIYHDFISKNEFLYFSEGVIGKLFNISYPYDIRFVHLIGSLYFNVPEMGANTGYLGSGYANMGFFGMILYSLLFSFILILLNSITNRMDSGLVIGITLFSIIDLNDADFLTTLLTGGFLFLILILYFYMNIENKNKSLDKININT